MLDRYGVTGRLPGWGDDDLGAANDADSYEDAGCPTAGAYANQNLGCLPHKPQHLLCRARAASLDKASTMLQIARTRWRCIKQKCSTLLELGSSQEQVCRRGLACAGDEAYGIVAMLRILPEVDVGMIEHISMQPEVVEALWGQNHAHIVSPIKQREGFEEKVWVGHLSGMAKIVSMPGQLGFWPMALGMYSVQGVCRCSLLNAKNQNSQSLWAHKGAAHAPTQWAAAF